MSPRSIRRLALCALALLGPGVPAGAQGPAGKPSLPPSEPRVLDRVVAVVRPAPRDRLEGAREALITLSDVRFEAAVALLQSGALAAALQPLEESGLSSALDYAISQRLHLQEAERLRAFAVQPAELEAAVAALETRLGSPEALAEFLRMYERSAADLTRVLERGLRAARALDSKVRLRAQVSEADVRRAYDADLTQHAWSFEERRGLIREMVFRQRYQTLARAETEELRQRADVRVLWTPAGSAGGLP